MPVDQHWLQIRSRKRFAPGSRCFTFVGGSIRTRSLPLLYLFRRFFELSEGQAFGHAWVKASTSCVLGHSSCLGPDISNSVSWWWSCDIFFKNSGKDVCCCLWCDSSICGLQCCSATLWVVSILVELSTWFCQRPEFFESLSILRDAVFVFQLDWVWACFLCLNLPPFGNVSHSVELGSLHLVSGFTQLLVNLLEGFVPEQQLKHRWQQLSSRSEHLFSGGIFQAWLSFQLTMSMRHGSSNPQPHPAALPHLRWLETPDMAQSGGGPQEALGTGWDTAADCGLRLTHRTENLAWPGTQKKKKKKKKKKKIPVNENKKKAKNKNKTKKKKEKERKLLRQVSLKLCNRHSAFVYGDLPWHANQAQP